ncbi:N-acetyltransferase domain-containing protein [Mycena indigotica]|uniref:N-acetyltransferase domain-containing protein n=1 Tax=Mycena indigotica TaxID=2126181 RepID=A0A8H6WCM4_9AGAR|nr:N-acetyltransferase domain-containing protein [Mycena indigotica]KAF7307524.1 N-acetyltransferase domain-containing protein [Mycena indigotica]
MATYSTLALPCPRTDLAPPDDFSALCERYAALRLEALTTSPTAFGSSYAIESAFTPEHWAAKVWREDAVVLVCVAHAIGEDPRKSGTWVASAILRGPMPLEEYTLPPESNAPQPGSDTEETHWQMTAVFASAAHRGRGLGKLLIQAAKDYALNHTRTTTCTRVRLRAIVHPDNIAVLGLYTRFGFADVARTTGKEAYRTNGDVKEWEHKLETLTDDLKVRWQTALHAVVLEWEGSII